MEIKVDEEGFIELGRVFNPVSLKSDNEKISVCFRDGGIKIAVMEDRGKDLGYWWNHYRVENGKIYKGKKGVK